jgi:DNA-directed RNA polymerase subunit RPC12/RpoP
VRFTCERCGKKYATAEDPAPGRVYKLKCKACGHLIVVKVSASSPAPASASAPVVAPPPIPAPPGVEAAAAVEPPPSTGSIGIEIGTPEPASIPVDGAALPESVEATTQVSTAALGDPVKPAAGGETGYVDLFSDVSGLQELQQKPGEDPFLAAARASLPEGYGAGAAGAPDPLAALRDDISATSKPDPRARAARVAAKVPFIPRPKQARSNVPLILIGAGVAVLVGILAFALLSAKSASAPAPVPAVAAPPLAPAAAPSAAPTPASESASESAPPAQAAPAPAPEQGGDADRRTRAEQRRKQREEAQAREEKARADRGVQVKAVRTTKQEQRDAPAAEAPPDRSAADAEGRGAARDAVGRREETAPASAAGAAVSR